MDSKTLINRTITVFVALAMAGIIVAGSSKLVTDALDQTILVAVGSAVFGAALSFFLVRFLSLTEK